VQYLFGGTQSRLADGLEEIDEVIAPIQKMIMKVQEQLGSFLDWSSGPVSLCASGQLCADFDIGRSGSRERTHHPSSNW
jgi:hypothetical protein